MSSCFLTLHVSYHLHARACNRFAHNLNSSPACRAAAAASGGSGGARLWYATDSLGSVAYDPWAMPQQGSVPTFGFTGKLQQGANVYLRARWYDSQRGVFSSRDPFVGQAEEPQSFQTYAYVQNNPVNAADPSGWYHCSSNDNAGTPAYKRFCQTQFSALDDYTKPFTGVGGNSLSGLIVMFDDRGCAVNFPGGSGAVARHNRQTNPSPAGNSSNLSFGQPIKIAMTIHYIKKADMYRIARDYDDRGDIAQRDCVLRRIVSLPDRAWTDKEKAMYLQLGRRGNSVQDLRLTVKGDRFGSMVSSGQIRDLATAQRWLSANLGPISSEPGPR